MLTKIAKQVTKVLSIPTIGIGASEYCDGQILVSEDMLGMYGNNHPNSSKDMMICQKISNCCKNSLKM